MQQSSFFQTIIPDHLSDRQLPDQYQRTQHLRLPDHQFFTWGTLPEFLSFENTQAFTDYAQLDQIEGNVWFLCFAGDSPYLMSEHYTYELKLKFQYEVYDIELYRLTKIQ